MSKPHTIIEFIQRSTEFLARKGIETARLDAEVLLGHVLGKDRVYLYVHFDQPLEPAEIDAYRTLIVRRGRREPVAYIVGSKEFFSRPFTVDSSVLIPRPETELLVETVVEWAKERGPLQIADIGTGSGAIAISLATALEHSTIWAVDVSREALRVASANAEQLGVSDRIQFLHGTWLAPLEGKVLDAVVSNPPYIPSADIDQLQPEVRAYEPRLALDGGEDGLNAYRALIPQAATMVRGGGLLAVEVGYGQAQSVAALGRASGWHLERIIPDHAGIDRVVCLRRGE